MLTPFLIPRLSFFFGFQKKKNTNWPSEDNNLLEHSVVACRIHMVKGLSLNGAWLWDALGTVRAGINVILSECG